MRNTASINIKLQKWNRLKGTNKSQLWKSKAIHIKMRLHNIERRDKATNFES
jgi:hypothetical protein